ncbi:AAA family ATPase [Roseomonas hellenica]|uniref:AAA family ATPase n=1 Tax=Plastoroseomonas hellenica TaxID=2687306 RepID=A0ABS5EUQ3_9PROT|nr:AAA family ATPase [Plastoroseomonas hellenica]MBR0663999.1 AAA family ATPase [Plastoroseomonas hellenica]
MLDEIVIAGEGSYPEAGERLSSLKALNFVFGANGSGKTTISRVVADPAGHPKCNLSWQNGRRLDSRVYNSDFVAKNFAEATAPGIFTLGEENAETRAKIDATKKKVDDLEREISRLTLNIEGADGKGGKVGELKKARDEFDEKCWRHKTTHDTYFSAAFEGYRNQKSRFAEKMLTENAGNTAALHPLDVLKARAGTVYRRGIEPLPRVPTISLKDLRDLEGEGILAKRVIGKQDLDIAALIKRLGNSDWVKRGLDFLGEPGSPCPFCQQPTPHSLEQELNAYFDEAYLADMAELKRVDEAYDTFASAAIKRLGELVSSAHPSLDGEKMKLELERFEDRVTLNKRLLDQKSKEPSAPITLDSLGEIEAEITGTITSANAAVDEHNRMVTNLATERTTLTSEIWKRLLHDGAADIVAYTATKTASERAINGMNGSRTAKEGELAAARSELSMLERSVTSVLPTVTEINATLSSFGFMNFKLATAGENDGDYKVVRLDGSDAIRTLSEGERGFITFLYFYHLVRGSISASGVATDRVVVFDDPVSSLDSDVLFIVSALIKRVLDEACLGAGSVKQVFVLTHNVYFHKEVTFDPKRQDVCRAHETFWIIRKLGKHSKIIGYGHNPIKTSYELLWAEVRDPNRSKVTIQNTLRRIVENYFKILGNLDKDDIIAKFTGRDKTICASLFSWVNDGSHSHHDDIFVSADDGLVERYLAVFRDIFVQTGHIKHYEMMMGPIPAAEARDASAASRNAAAAA